MLLGSCPQNHGLEGRIWTGATMQAYLQNTYLVSYRSGVYELLERLGLSHQKAHADYSNADPAQQWAFLNELTETLLAADEQTTVATFEEFSVCDRPTAAYCWAEKNTRPTFQTEKKRERSNGLLAVELFGGECFFRAARKANTEQVAAYFSELAAHLQAQGYTRANFFLDNNTPHLDRMKDLFGQHSGQLHLQVSFHHFPKYSPKLNLTEYLIHLIRAKWLHHTDYRQRLEAVEEKLVGHLHKQIFLAKENIINILQHIQDLVCQT